MLDTKETIDTTPVTIEPANGWRNWARVIKPYRSEETGAIRRPGDLVRGQHVWPTKDIAESKAEAYSRTAKSAVREGFLKYLGAFPEGTTP